jgi:hypothetical protein
MSAAHVLPSKAGAYLRRLDIEYGRQGTNRLRLLLQAARYVVREATDYDNWNGGTYGHDVVLFLPPSTLATIGFDQQAELSGTICDDLRKCAATVENEYFRAVHIELADDSDPEFQKSVPFSSRTQVEPETVPFWTPGYLRLFISHRDGHKAAAKKLADVLEGYGVSAFVAHDTIEPMTTWQNEIIKGLQTMEVMLTFITDDFHDSVWTNQEVGYALGKGVPIISLKLERRDPGGFIGTEQALRGSLADPTAAAPAVYRLLAEKVGQKRRLQQTLINAFVNSPDFTETKARFDRMASVVDKLDEDQFRQLVAGFKANDQLHNAGHLTSKYQRFKNFLERCTGKKVEIHHHEVVEIRSPDDDEIPF